MMNYKNKLIAIFIFLLCIVNTNAQQTIKDSIAKNLKFNYKQLIIPGVLIGYGLIGLESDQLKGYNLIIRNEVTEDIDKKISVDDFSQYIPALAVYGLNNIGIEGKNNLKDRSIILGISMVLVFTSVTALKYITNVERPDGTSYAFPSGHTATAFAGAEFLWQEYKDKSIWYGISGYAIATATGIIRITNNKHWLTDVAAGAGIGILSTKIAYWLNPYIKRKIFKEKDPKTVSMIAPYYNGNQIGCSYVYRF
jgi:membrane-associated phospholipid phosphatase